MGISGFWEWVQREGLCCPVLPSSVCRLLPRVRVVVVPWSLPSVPRFLRFPISTFLGLYVFRFLSFHCLYLSQFLRFSVSSFSISYLSLFLSFSVSTFLGLFVFRFLFFPYLYLSQFLRFSVSTFPGFYLSLSLSFSVFTFLGLFVFRFLSFPVSSFLGLYVSRSLPEPISTQLKTRERRVDPFFSLTRWERRWLDIIINILFHLFSMVYKGK